MSTRQWRWLAMVSVWLACVAWGWRFTSWGYQLRALAQERPARETRTWEVMAWPGAGGYAPVRVMVIDTDGVCLYVTRTHSMGSRPRPATIAAVPKTQLPKGAGCQ